jgi:hypothetical protein
MVAFKAAGDDVIPGFAAPFHHGYDMIERQIFRGAFCPAVLAGIVIPCINVCSAEFDVLVLSPDLYILKEPKHAGHFYGETDTPDLAIIFRQDLDFALAQQIQGALPGDDVDRFIGGI